MTQPGRIVRLAARGDGVTAAGDYVPGAVPGDVLTPDGLVKGPEHVLPPCRHFPECGGCQLQHASEPVLGDFTSGRILGALKSAGVQPDVVHPVHLSPPRTRRRASLRARTQGGRLAVGFNEERSRRVIDMRECHVLTPAIFALVESARPLLASELPADWVSGLTVTETETGADVLISNLESSSRLISALSDWAARQDIARIALETPGGTDIAVQRRDPVQSFGGVQVVMPPGAFLQATRDGEAALTAAVLEGLQPYDRAADLFAGLGTFALPLSQRMKVHAADAAGPATHALEEAAKKAGRAVTAEHRDLFRRPLTAKELSRYPALILDPPRAGAKAQVEVIARSKVEALCYVSCNPSTFARDAKTLTQDGDFRLAELWPVGQFRWSTHVELAARFAR